MNVSELLMKHLPNPSGVTKDQMSDAIDRMNDEANAALRERIIAHCNALNIPATIDVSISVRWTMTGLR